MAPPKCSDDEFIAIWKQLGSASLVAEHLGMSVRRVHDRRKLIENNRGVPLNTFNDQRGVSAKILHTENKIRSVANITGCVIVFSDAHFQPSEPTTGFLALIKLIKKLKPSMIVANGDILDGALISKYGPEGWDSKPTLKQELEAVQWHMDQIVKACKGLGTILHRTVGNHDVRFDKRLAGLVPEYKDIGGTRLSDHIPEWSESWSLMVNEVCMIKHRLQHSGIHSSYNNVLKSGLSTCSGHTHLLEIKGWTDYKGRRWGVSTGMLADPKSTAFAYLEDNPVPWCQGFAILHFDNDGALLPPELVEVVEGKAYFRGTEI